MNQQPPKTAVDKLIYTASLVTNTQEVDPILDSLRALTSRNDYNPNQLTAQDSQVIAELQSRLEAYLVNGERLRFFTPESLQLQIEQFMSGSVGNVSRSQLIGVLVVATVLSVGLAVLLPLDGPERRGQVGGSVAFSVVNVGAAWLLLMALPAFKSKLRKAFRLICGGVALIGLSLLAHPIVEVFNLRHYPLTSLLLPLPLLAAAIIFYTGNAQYARLVGVKSVWTRPWPVLIGCLILAAVTWIIPHRPVPEPELVFDLAAVMWGCMLLMPLASTFILPRVVKQLPELYKPSARALSYSMWTIIAVIGYQYALRLIAGPYMSGPVAYGLFSLVVVMGVALMRVGYTFSKVSRY